MAGYDPPPFFRQGPAPLALLVFYVAISVALLILDVKFHYLEVLRRTISMATQPLQLVAQLPLRGVRGAAGYVSEISGLREDNERLRSERLVNAPRLQRLSDLEIENEKLRKLLALRERYVADTVAVKVLYTSRDPFTRRVIVNRGSNSGVIPGQPVVDEVGIVGQVTRVFPLVSEVTLITDKEQAIPVKVVRNGLRSLSFGLGNGQIELRYMPTDADVQVGDLVVTSGLDGTYHAGFPVARVTSVERETSYSFARILCTPIAGVENHDTVLLVKPHASEAARPPELGDRFSSSKSVQSSTGTTARRAKR